MNKQMLPAAFHYSRSLPVFRVKDPISALTHFIGFWASLLGLPLILIRAAYFHSSVKNMVSFSIFMISMILLYGASTAYHSFHISEGGDMILKKIDHMMIFVLIAGSYTPVCTIVLPNPAGTRLLLLIWGIAILGVAFKAFWVTCPKWVSSVIYIVMGWAALLAIRPIYQCLPGTAFFWLLAGGILYTVGGVIYALKLNVLARHFKMFGAHELFHIFVMMGSFCHYMMMFLYLTGM